MQWDVVIQNACAFDGTGAPGRVLDIAVRDGRIAASGHALPVDAAKTTAHGTVCLRQALRVGAE